VFFFRISARFRWALFSFYGIVVLQNTRGEHPSKENKMKQTISKKTFKALEKIAMEKNAVIEERGGLERKWNDEMDFPEIAVWSIEQMLIAAYQLGRKDAREGK
jgi:hypothetical protein